MKKILILTNNLNGGGAEKVLLTLLNNLSPQDYEITLTLVYKTGVYLHSIPSHVKINYIFEDNIDASEHILNDSDAIYENFLQNDCDIEIAFLEGNATKILSKSTNEKSLKIAWVHIDLFSEHYTQKIYSSNQDELETYYVFDKIAFVSSAALSGFELLFGDSLHDRSVIVYNPINTNEIKQKSNEKPEIKKEKTTICTVGRLAPQKGYRDLICAASHLIKEGFDFNLWILGEGKLEKELQDLCVELDLSNHIVFWGFQNNPYKYIKASDAFVCSSRAEGLSLVIGEALFLRKPIISTRCSGPNEVLSKGNWGLLVDTSENGIYEGLKTFLNQPNSVPVLSSESIAIYNEFYGLDSYIQRIKKLLNG
ncbi:MAG: glycosyltransferase [Clostridia bacterium]|nr:glycosyltransferase [Clostridia bacterium]